VWTKRGDVGTTSPTVLARQEPLPKQSKYRSASLQHHPLIIAQAWNGCSCPLQLPRADSGRGVQLEQALPGAHQQAGQYASLHLEGKTCALSNQWGIASLPIIDEIASILPPDVKMTYSKTQKPS
jgi:hypothetical protein